MHGDQLNIYLLNGILNEPARGGTQGAHFQSTLSVLEEDFARAPMTPMDLYRRPMPMSSFPRPAMCTIRRGPKTCRRHTQGLYYRTARGWRRRLITDNERRTQNRAGKRLQTMETDYGHTSSERDQHDSTRLLQHCRQAGGRARARDVQAPGRLRQMVMDALSGLHLAPKVLVRAIRKSVCARRDCGRGGVHFLFLSRCRSGPRARFTVGRLRERRRQGAWDV